MSDNVTVNPGVIVGTRQEGGGDQVQRVIPQTYSTPGTSGGTVLDIGPGNPFPIDNVEIPGPATLADATANPSTGLLGTLPGLYNGATWDRARSASAANQSAFSGVGAFKMAKVGCWSQFSSPGAAAQPSTVKAAGGAGVRHVCTSLSATLTSVATPTITTIVTVNLRDGATGAGTVLWSTPMNVTAVAGQSFNISLTDLAIVGSANTAMTLEFAAVTGAALQGSVAMTGYDTV